MFSIFKKKENTATLEEMLTEEKQVEVMEAPTPEFKPENKPEGVKIKARSNSKYDDTDIGMLHNQFFGSSEDLLVDSQNFLKQREKELKGWEKKSIANKSKVNDLKTLGFGNTGQAKQFDDEIKEKAEEIVNARRDIEEKTEVANAVLHFANRYPAYKFITYNGIKEVCEKYNLVFGQNKLFTGFVPKTNLADIKKFWAWRDKTRVGVKLEDRAFVYNLNSYGSEQTFNSFEDVKKNILDKELKEAKDRYPKRYTEPDENGRAYGQSDYAHNWETEIRWHGGYTCEERKAHEDGTTLITHEDFFKRYMDENYSKENWVERHKDKLERAGMDERYIAAPSEDMDMDNHRIYDYEVVPEGKLEEMKLIEDPVVFYPVSFGNIIGGLIVTAWGDEASDPLVMNVKHN